MATEMQSPLPAGVGGEGSNGMGRRGQEGGKGVRPALGCGEAGVAQGTPGERESHGRPVPGAGTPPTASWPRSSSSGSPRFRGLRHSSNLADPPLHLQADQNPKCKFMRLHPPPHCPASPPHGRVRQQTNWAKPQTGRGAFGAPPVSKLGCVCIQKGHAPKQGVRVPCLEHACRPGLASGPVRRRLVGTTPETREIMLSTGFWTNYTPRHTQ